MNQRQPKRKETGPDSEEFVERRISTERKTETTVATATQSAGQTTSGLFRIREAAKKDPIVQFNNLYSHLTEELLGQAFKSLRKQASSLRGH